MSEENNIFWTCPVCNHLGNDNNFCAACGRPRPVTAPSAASVPQVAKAPEDDFTEQDRKKANILCTISLILFFVVSNICALLVFLVNETELPFRVRDVLSSLFGLLVTCSEIGAVVLMIYVRVKYRKSVFGKVLMWLYIVLAAMAVIGTIILVIICINELQKCGNSGL